MPSVEVRVGSDAAAALEAAPVEEHQFRQVAAEGESVRAEQQVEDDGEVLVVEGRVVVQVVRVELGPARPGVRDQVLVPVQVQAAVHDPPDPLEDLLLCVQSRKYAESPWCCERAPCVEGVLRLGCRMKKR